MTPKQEKEFLSKLQKPIHVSYISKYLLKKDINETKQILQKYIDENIIEESKLAKEYYGVKNI